LEETLDGRINQASKKAVPIKEIADQWRETPWGGQPKRKRAINDFC